MVWDGAGSIGCEGIESGSLLLTREQASSHGRNRVVVDDGKSWDSERSKGGVESASAALVSLEALGEVCSPNASSSASIGSVLMSKVRDASGSGRVSSETSCLTA